MPSNREGLISLEHTPGCPGILAWDILGACNCGGDKMWCLDCLEECEPVGDIHHIGKNGWQCPVCWAFMPEGGGYGDTVFWKTDDQ
jgi:hypothetical protein